MFGLSVCIIAKNEEKMIADCIQSVSNIANEIIVVDTGSNDRTIEIANGLGAIVLQMEWQNDFATARNFSLKNAKYEFILILDADERILDESVLQRTLETAKSYTGGWLLELTSYAFRADGTKDTYITSLLRLIRNRDFIRFKGVIHEQVIESILENNLKLEETKVRINHLGYALDADAMKKKQQRNLDLLLGVIAKESTNAYYFYQISKTYLALGDLNLAEKYMQDCLMYALANGTVRPQALNFGAIIAYQMKNYNLAEQRAFESLKIIPNQSFANYVLGEVAFDLSQHSAAIGYYKKVLLAKENLDTITKIVGDYHVPIEQLFFRIGRSFIALNEINQAEEYFKKGNEINPKEISLLVGLANIEFKKGKLDEAMSILLLAKQIDSKRTDLDNFIEVVKTVINQNKNLINSNIANNDNKKDNILTLSMIVKNEEKMLPGCLESVKGLVDEIIIVDTGSSDRTIEIAKSFGAKVFNFIWNDDFAAARNESLKHCTGKWILYLDADERIRPINNAKFREEVLKLPENIGGMVCTIESSHLALTGEKDFHRGGYPRIFKNLIYPKVKFIGRVHEQISPSLKDAGMDFINSDIVIEHLGYDQSTEIMQSKVQRNYKMLLQHVNEEPLNGYAWFQLGQTLGQMQLLKEAEEAIKFAISCENLSDSIFSSAANSLSLYSGKKGDFETALLWANKSLEKAPDQVYANTLKAYALLNLKRNKEAIPVFEELLAKDYDFNKAPLTGYDILVKKDMLQKSLEEAKKGLI